MPSLLRFLFWLFIIAGIGYGTMVALALYVKPRTGEITIRIPAEKLNPKPDPIQ